MMPFLGDRKFVKCTIEPHHMFPSPSTTFSFNLRALSNQPESFTHFIFPKYPLVSLPLYFSLGRTPSSDNLFPLFQLSLFTNMFLETDLAVVQVFLTGTRFHGNSPHLVFVPHSYTYILFHSIRMLKLVMSFLTLPR